MSREKYGAFAPALIIAPPYIFASGGNGRGMAVYGVIFSAYVPERDPVSFAAGANPDVFILTNPLVKGENCHTPLTFSPERDIMLKVGKK